MEEYQGKLRCKVCMSAITSRKERHHQWYQSLKYKLTLTKVKCTWTILQIYFKLLEVKYTSSILHILWN